MRREGERLVVRPAHQDSATEKGVFTGPAGTLGGKAEEVPMLSQDAAPGMYHGDRDVKAGMGLKPVEPKPFGLHRTSRGRAS